MFLNAALEVWLLSFSITQALVLQLPGEVNGTTPTSSIDPPSASSFSPSRNFSPVLNGSLSNEWETRCDATLYGSNLNINSCLGAFEKMSQAGYQEIYRPRADPDPSDYQLPMMFMAGKFLFTLLLRIFQV